MQANPMDESVFITDSEGTIECVNPQFERTTGYAAAEATWQTPFILGSDGRDEEFCADLRTITAEEVWEATLTNERKTDEQYTVDQRIAPVTDGQGEMTNFVSIEEDVTDREFVDEWDPSRRSRERISGLDRGRRRQGVVRAPARPTCRRSSSA